MGRSIIGRGPYLAHGPDFGHAWSRYFICRGLFWSMVNQCTRLKSLYRAITGYAPSWSSGVNFDHGINAKTFPKHFQCKQALSKKSYNDYELHTSLFHYAIRTRPPHTSKRKCKIVTALMRSKDVMGCFEKESVTSTTLFFPGIFIAIQQRWAKSNNRKSLLPHFSYESLFQGRSSCMIFSIKGSLILIGFGPSIHSHRCPKNKPRETNTRCL